LKGLEALPKTSDLLIAYTALESRAPIEESRLALLSQWARLDSRLAELLTGYLQFAWHGYNSVNLLHALSEFPWPRAILVPLRFVETVAGDETQIKRVALRSLISAVEEAFPEKTNDLYFIPLQRMNRVLLNQAIDFQSLPYRRSGYIGSASLLAKGRIPQQATIVGAKERARILDEIILTLRRGDELAVEDYIGKLQGRVSRRQAQRDLESSPKLKSVGFTRSKRYLLAKKAQRV
jgi:hypothetical protein